MSKNKYNRYSHLSEEEHYQVYGRYPGEKLSDAKQREAERNKEFGDAMVNLALKLQSEENENYER